MMTDPIADMLTRIRNAQMAHKDSAEVPNIPGLAMVIKGWYTFLPKITRADFNRIKNAIELYKRVLMAA